jgi:uncharacterized protein (DUF302 family)
MKRLIAAALPGALALSIAGVVHAGPATMDGAGQASARLRPMIAKGEGIVDVPSRHSVDETVARLEQLLKAKGVPVFALIDHSGEAAKVGLQMRPTKLLIFGNPKAGTPPMLAAPSLAIDLPLKILVWQDGTGKVWLSYNSLEYLRERHGVPRQLIQNLAVVETLAATAGQ